MGFHIEERFVVRADADAVFAYLLDARRVVTCLPGAELTEAVDPTTFRGAMRVKVGPVTMAYRGTVLVTEADAAARRMRISGEAKESTGAGSARMTLESVTRPLPGGEAEIAVRADVDVAGRAVQLGRGMIEQVSVQLVKQFATSLRKALEVGAAAPPPAGAAAGAPERPAPLRALPLLFRAAWAAVVAFFRRLLARGR
jgi:carbon monoxide dehydrogenase subunit G